MTKRMAGATAVPLGAHRSMLCRWAANVMPGYDDSQHEVIQSKRDSQECSGDDDNAHTSTYTLKLARELCCVFALRSVVRGVWI